MKRFLKYSLNILIPVFVGIPIVNYFVDPGHVYSEEYIDRVVKGLCEGWNVTNVADINERILKEKHVKALKGNKYEYVVLGASKAMTIASEDLYHKEMINLAMSGAKLEDLLAIYELCKENNIKYNKIIIGIEPTLFNANDDDKRWKSLEGYYRRFIGNEGGNSIGEEMLLVNNLFSASYFKSSILYLCKMEEGIEYSKSYKNEGATKRPDGSMYYARYNCDKLQTEIDEGATTWMHSSFMNYSIMSVKHVDLFERLIDSLRKDKVSILFFKIPYHPLFYKRHIKGHKTLAQANQYIDSLAFCHHIKIIGDYNPDKCGLKNTDFYDAVHARKESISRILKNNYIEFK